MTKKKKEEITNEQIINELPKFNEFVNDVISEKASLSIKRNSVDKQLVLFKEALLKIKEAGKDKDISYILLSNSIFKHTGLKIGVTKLRNYCQNTLNFQKKINRQAKLTNSTVEQTVFVKKADDF